MIRENGTTATYSFEGIVYQRDRNIHSWKNRIEDLMMKYFWNFDQRIHLIEKVTKNAFFN